ncbi:MAG TPA: SbcC/MukB-like Walker B domain-containing protein, partial [Microlunatus sp.]|nr:SbcC/MukB-like Walker B domain-containing protein [Microlunatus sp.]
AAEDALAAGPAAAPLAETLRWHSDLSRETTRLPVAATAARQASVALDRARRAADDAEQLLDERRRDDEEQRTHQAEAATTVERWTNQLALLRSVVVPDGTAALDQAARRADRAVRECEQQLAAAESAATAARSTRQDLPERSAVTAVQRAIESYATATEQRRQLQERRQELTAQTATAESALATARSSLNRARAEVERLQAQWSAAGLRSHLAVGHECPVCEQRVGVVPDALAVPELDGARAAAAEQEATRQVAEEHAAGLRSRLTGLIAQAGGVDDRLSELDRILQQDLPGQSAGDVRDVEGDRSAAADLLRRLDAAVAGQEVADRALEAARAAVRRAQHEVAGIAEQTADSWAALHAARGRLAILDPPSVSGEGLAVAWTALVDWAAGRADGLESTELRAARAALSDADTAAVASGQRLRDATTAARRTSAELTAAVVAEAKATAEHENLLRRVAELEVSLADRPRVDEAERLLSEHRQLALAAEGARGAARAAVRTRQQAEADRDRCRAEREAARSALHRVREPLISMAVPAVDDTDLRRAWAELAEWARVTSRSCRADMVEAQAEHTAVDDELGHRLTRLGALLAEHGVGAAVPSAGDVSTPDGGGRLARIPTEVEIAVERARAATAELGRRRLAAEQLRRQIATETETEQVARQLALMMSAKRFPQWLADAALDSLVADASSSLLQLSGGQFELTHDRGEFFVIDHADADSARSVKTLSGGETFQASLALALALSEQLSTLAAGGRTTLDSIFLDEGFGTLDPDALEIVASTLENLAQGNRMVGVVTHVAALADRVPVRFQVSRDSRTSTIERVGA